MLHVSARRMAARFERRDEPLPVLLGTDNFREPRPVRPGDALPTRRCSVNAAHVQNAFLGGGTQVVRHFIQRNADRIE